MTGNEIPRWNADALQVPMGADSDRDARYRAINARKHEPRDNDVAENPRALWLVVMFIIAFPFAIFAIERAWEAAQ